MSFILPIDRLLETNTLVAFHHPQPSYPVHIVIVPKKPIKNFLGLTVDDQDFINDLVQSVQGLIRDFELEQTGYRLIVNGGLNQNFPYLHFHLISDGRK